jgi:hypothetical protein
MNRKLRKQARAIIGLREQMKTEGKLQTSTQHIFAQIWMSRSEN